MISREARIEKQCQAHVPLAKRELRSNARRMFQSRSVKLKSNARRMFQSRSDDRYVARRFSAGNTCPSPLSPVGTTDSSTLMRTQRQVRCGCPTFTSVEADA